MKIAASSDMRKTHKIQIFACYLTMHPVNTYRPYHFSGKMKITKKTECYAMSLYSKYILKKELSVFDDLRSRTSCCKLFTEKSRLNSKSPKPLKKVSFLLIFHDLVTFFGIHKTTTTYPLTKSLVCKIIYASSSPRCAIQIWHLNILRIDFLCSNAGNFRDFRCVRA